MLDDVRFGWRKLQQQPGFTVVAVYTLALGIGATSAVFSLVGSLADRATLPSPRNTRAHSSPPQRRAPSQREALVGGAVERVAARLKAFESFAGYGWSFNFLVIDDGESLEGMFVSKDYFRVVGLEPVLGHAFSDAEVNFPPAPVIVIGYDLWQRKFGGDPNIIGTKVRISRRETPRRSSA